MTTSDYYLEGQKIFYDFFKLLVTVSSGLIAFSGVLLNVFRPADHSPIEAINILRYCFILLSVTILASLIGMLMIGSAIFKENVTGAPLRVIGWIASASAGLSFFIAIILLAAFVFSNI